QNPFNPALVGRVVLLVSWPALMTTWPAPDVPKNFSDLFKNPDAVTAATPLGVLKAGGTKALDENRPDAEKTFASLKAGYEKSDSDKNEYSISKKAPLYLNLFLGNCGGSLGEISALALIIGGIYLFYKGHITFHIPASYLTTVIVISGIFWIADSAKYADPLFHILSGGVMLGALFMATDMTTTPIAASGMIIFGIGCGLITMTIRLFGSYPEGASFSILIMNALTPLIDRYAKPKRYGV
nr:RnfABCDGE type electron transport complex subunit D [bacterium]